MANIEYTGLPQQSTYLYEDCCPECMTEPHQPFLPWRKWYADMSGTLYGDYVCNLCGYSWWTGWQPQNGEDA